MSKKRVFRVGTRASALALAQSKLFCDELRRRHPEVELEMVPITTSGDKIQDRFLSAAGGKGLFVKEIEEALGRGEIDWAVHSMKDLPAEIAEFCAVVCIPIRLSYEDVLLSRGGGGLEEIPSGGCIGTSSLRRRVQLHKIRPDLQFKLLRGNIDTRVRKLSEGEFDGIVLARAGLIRLNLSVPTPTVLPILPAPGQGALAIEARREDSEVVLLLEGMNDYESERCVLTERRVMRALGGDCNLPLGVLAQKKGNDIQISVFLGTADGSDAVSEGAQGSWEQSEEVVEALIERLFAKGAQAILDKIKCGGFEPS